MMDMVHTVGLLSRLLNGTGSGTGNNQMPETSGSTSDICYDSDNQRWVLVYTDNYTNDSLLVRTGQLVGGHN